MQKSRCSGALVVALTLAAIAASFLPCYSASAEILVSEDFSNDPHWTTDQPGNFFWNGASGTYFARAYLGVPNYRPNRFSVLTLPDFNPTKSFTLSWDQRLLSVNQAGMAFFGVYGNDLLNDRVSYNGLPPLVPESTINIGVGRSGSDEFTETNVCTKTGADHGVGGSHGPTFALNAWYRFTVTYDAVHNTVKVRAVDRSTGAVMLYFDATHTVPANAFSATMVNVGIAIDPLGYQPGTIWYNKPAAYIEAEFDNVLLEGERRRLPAPPTHLTSAWLDGRVLLQWRDLASNETQFKIERRADPGGTYAQIAATAHNVNLFHDASAVAANSYCYRVRAANGDGDSAYSNESCIAGSAGTAGQSLQFSSASYSVASTPGDAAVTIARSGGTAGSISVTILVSGGTASLGDDYRVLTSAPIAFAPGEASKVVYPIRVLSSASADPRTVHLELSKPTGTVAIGTPGKTTMTIQPATTTAVEMLDPVCIRKPTRASCAGELLNAAGYPANVTAREAMTVRRIGAVADGVSLLLLRVRSTVPVTFSLRVGNASAPAAYGALLAVDGTPAGSSLRVVPEQTAAGLTAHALYLAPVDLPPSPADLRLVATPDSGSPAETPLLLTSPPVVLLHGVWSSAWAFADPYHLPQSLYAYLVDRGFHVVTADYRDDPAGSFDPSQYSAPILSLSDATDAALRKARARGFAAAQVDVVGHSMGGLVARARATGTLPQGWDLMRSPTAYARPENRGQGDIHKLITIGTPHHGTPAATWFLENRCRSVGPFWTLQGFLAGLGRPLDDAIYQFQPSHPLLGIVGKSPVWTHTISGRAPVLSFTEVNLETLIGLTGSLATIETIFGSAEHDLIVPIASQLAGRSSASTTTRVESTIHADLTLTGRDRTIAETTNTSIHAIVLALLRGLRADRFEVFGPPAIQGTPLPPGDCPASDAAKRAIHAEGVELTPAAGTIVRPGEEILVRFVVPDDDATSEALFAIDGAMTEVEGTDGVFTLLHQIPERAAGTLRIVAVTTRTDGTNHVAETFVIVRPAVPPDILTAAPGSIAFDVPDATAQLVVLGEYADGSTIELTPSAAGTVYATKSGATSVVAVDADGRVTARGNGQETIVIRNGILTASVGVVVEITNRRPALAAIAEARVHPGGAVEVAIGGSDPDGQTIRLTAAAAPPFATLTDRGDGTGVLRFTPGAADAGTYEFPVTAIDSGTPPLGVSQPARVIVYAPFTDPTLVPRVTPIRAVHITELRARIDGLRARRGLAPFAWSGAITVRASTIRAQHVRDLRSALRDVYVSAGATPPTYTDATLNAGGAIKAVHVAQIRAALVAIE